MMRKALPLLLTALLLLTATGVQGAGYAVWEMGSKSSGMGGVFTATADDPTAIFFNPAGIGRLDGRQASVDLTLIRPYTEFSGVGPHPGYGVTEHLDDPLFFLPQVYYTQQLDEQWTLGAGFYTPYGLAVEWADAETFTGRNIATKTDLKTFYFTPTVAFTPDERVTVGLGFNAIKSTVELHQAVVETVGNPTELGRVEISGDGDWAFSFNAGLLIDIADNTTLGFTYKSSVDLEIAGDADFIAQSADYETALPADGPVETTVPMPAVFSVGIASQVSEKLLLEFNFNRWQWSSFEELPFIFPEAPENNKAIREDYEDTSQYRIGAEYQASPELALRAGFILDETPQPDGGMGPVLPDADRKGVSIGAGYDFGNAMVNVYNLFLFLEDRDIRTNWDGYNGDYRSYTNLFGLGLHYRF